MQTIIRYTRVHNQSIVDRESLNIESTGAYCQEQITHILIKNEHKYN